MTEESRRTLETKDRPYDSVDICAIKLAGIASGQSW